MCSVEAGMGGNGCSSVEPSSEAKERAGMHSLFAHIVPHRKIAKVNGMDGAGDGDRSLRCLNR
ncbi:hypothetical protein GGQ77_000721 [Geobacillus thermodenitrificans]|nr:hypothetical protein [Geobacillus thermodenitrificans]